MKIIMIAVSSINGKITRGDEQNIYSWTSKEDSGYFFDMIDRNNLIVMGSKTYDTAKRIIKHKKRKLRIVMTRRPEKYKKDKIEGQLEFCRDSPKELANRFEKLGYKKMLLVGGSEINTMFLKAGLVNELHLTIEPCIFGKGKNLIHKDNLESKMKLIKIQKLNKKGTFKLVYSLAT